MAVKGLKGWQEEVYSWDTLAARILWVRMEANISEPAYW